MNKFLIYIFIVVFLSSCMSTKKTSYFQGEPSPISELYKFHNDPYKLQINDILSVTIKAEDPKLIALFETPEDGGGELYFNGYTIDRHGNIRIPYIGELNVLGYTATEVREKIEIELKNFIKRPETIFVDVKLSGIQFLVTGEVGSPGTVSLLQNQVSILDAIANAGEISEFGDRENVFIVRKSLDGVKKYKIDMTDIAIFESEYFYIQPNDIVYVPALKQKFWGTGTTGLQTFTTLASILTVLASSVLLIKNL
ncbi:MAG: polysaccharide export outer membrane protein [Candidatus Azotimanducaceae bacterium]|jgi:polysaccharide export outer membrane protein